MLEVGSWKLDVRCWIASLTLAMTVLLLSVAAPVLAQEGALPENPAADNALAQDKVFNAAETVLENGLRVIVVPNHRAPVVTQMVWYKVGAADEPFGVSGSAHFLEHLLFRGSKVIGGDDLPPGEFSKIVRGMGGNDNAFTSLDYTAYFQSVPADALEQVMRMEAGRMRGALFSEADIESERNVILEERRQRTDNDPRGRFGEQMIADAFINHPYGKPVIGWLQEMEALSHNDTYSFYQRWYAPNNATLVISGDVEAERVFALAREIYGQVPQQDVPERKRPVSPDFHSKTRVTLEHPIIRQPMFQILYRVPGYRQNREQSLALQLLEEIMSGGQSARLYKSLVAEQKLASGAGMSYRADSWDD
ncbi:MAG: M16 family metallopeptidase, partial [Bdellovibrionales bacterium]